MFPESDHKPTNVTPEPTVVPCLSELTFPKVTPESLVLKNYLEGELRFFLQEPFGFFHIESSCRCSLKPILGNRPICFVVHFEPPQIVWPRKKTKSPVSIEKNCWSGFVWKFCSPKSSGVLKSFLWHAISGVYILCSDAPKWCFHIFLWILNFEMANHFKVSKFAVRVATGHKF